MFITDFREDESEIGIKVNGASSPVLGAVFERRHRLLGLLFTLQGRRETRPVITVLRAFATAVQVYFGQIFGLPLSFPVKQTSLSSDLTHQPQVSNVSGARQDSELSCNYWGGHIS